MAAPPDLDLCPLMPTYGAPSVMFVRGEGAELWDNHDKRYLDFLSGIAVCSLGHSHPRLPKQSPTRRCASSTFRTSMPQNTIGRSRARSTASFGRVIPMAANPGRCSSAIRGPRPTRLR